MRTNKACELPRTWLSLTYMNFKWYYRSSYRQSVRLWIWDSALCSPVASTVGRQGPSVLPSGSHGVKHFGGNSLAT